MKIDNATYNYVFITELPVFYKVNLYNRLSENLNIFVIFLASQACEERSADFVNLDNAQFDYTVLKNTNLQNRHTIKNFSLINTILKGISYHTVVFCAWNFLETWLLCFSHSRSRNAFVLESSIKDSTHTGWKALFKRILLSRISVVFASGQMQKELLKALKYNGEIIETHGVGIINKPRNTLSQSHFSGKFIYVGRLVEIKNVQMLINIFNGLPSFQLTIVGTGELSAQLQASANINIKFMGTVKNSDIGKMLKQNDIFILPSRYEPWGLVAEEAIYHGLPVLLSEACGVTSILNKNPGCLLFDPTNEEDLINTINKIDAEKYYDLCTYTGPETINYKDTIQVASYQLTRQPVIIYE